MKPLTKHQLQILGFGISMFVAGSIVALELFCAGVVR